MALLLGAYALYPKRTDLVTPGYTQLVLQTTVPVRYVEYLVKSSAVPATMTISVVLAPGQRAGPTTLQVWLPYGLRFAHCRSDCGVQRRGHQISAYWIEAMAFKPAGSGLAATANLAVQASDFGVAFNGVNASAAIPEITYQGPDNPKPALITGYHLQSASSYDWSSLPTETATSSAAVWFEYLPSGDTPARVAVGIDHAAESNDNTMILLAGTLLGLAGGALLSAVQEALHADG